MVAGAIDGLARAGAARLHHLETNRLAIWLASMLAGACVGLGILPSFSVGSAADPAVRPRGARRSATQACERLCRAAAVRHSARDPRGHIMPTISLPLPLSRHRLVFVPEEPMRLPAFAGSAWRGGLGWALKRLVCVMRLRPCEGCPLELSCIYPTIFAARPDEEAQKMRRYERVPNPFVLHQIHPPRTTVGPEDRVVLELGLAGRACRQIAYLVRALDQAGEGGIGPDRGRLRLLAVSPVESPWAPLELEPESQAIRAEGATPAIPEPWPRVELRLCTPLRLQHEGRLVGPQLFEPACLAMALVRRVSMLCHHHGEADLAADFAALKAQAQAIRVLDRQLEWTEQLRRSSRQQAVLPMGGLIGRLVLDLSDAPGLWPFLWLGQWLHAGKGATMGMGAYRLRRASDC